MTLNDGKQRGEREEKDVIVSDAKQFFLLINTVFGRGFSPSISLFYSLPIPHTICCRAALLAVFF
jgi:hypothetical protein